VQRRLDAEKTVQESCEDYGRGLNKLDSSTDSRKTAPPAEAAREA